MYSCFLSKFPTEEIFAYCQSLDMLNFPSVEFKQTEVFIEEALFLAEISTNFPRVPKFSSWPLTTKEKLL